MKRLSMETVNALDGEQGKQTVQRFTYDRAAVSVGIVHFGIGNFHRAHQAVYVDDLLERGHLQWGIAGVSLRSSAMQEALKPQDYLYTLATLSDDPHYRIIGALQDILVAPKDPQAVIDVTAKISTQLVTTTITEKGYYLTSGTVDFEHPALRAEVECLARPTTIYGFLASAIIKRSRLKGSSSKLTIMCCDNISAGGDLLKKGAEHLLAIHDEEALAWSKTHIGFISSMVDRVCPATRDNLRGRTEDITHMHDAWPVSAEPFSQWVIEQNFAGERPDFDHVGAIFVEDIAPFERMKLGYLNAAHTMIATLGYLSADDFVHESLARPEIAGFVQKALHESVLPYAEVPQGYDGADYIQDVLARFQNSHLPYGNLQVGTDSSQKIQQRWLPTIDRAVAKNADNKYWAFCLAAWVVFIQTALKNNVLNDPKREAFEMVDTHDLNQMVQDYLTLANADKFEFFKNPSFINTVENYAQSIKIDGLEKALSFVSA